MTPMMNMYDTIRGNLHFNKFAVGELLFVEYKCPIEQDVAGVWTPMDYFVHVLSGKKTWRTIEGIWTAEKGQTLFFKKGAAILHQDFKEDFCVLVFFVLDNFIRVITKAMEIVGGAGFYRGFGLERLFRDIQAARYHPLPESDQVKFSGEYLLRD